MLRAHPGLAKEDNHARQAPLQQVLGKSSEVSSPLQTPTATQGRRPLTGRPSRRPLLRTGWARLGPRGVGKEPRH